MSAIVLKTFTHRTSSLVWTTTSRLLSSKTVQCEPYDLVVVGGGIIGCATAREMKERHPNLKIAIVEKENDLAQHQTGHNSGVVHAGIYYTPGSVKAKLCVEGVELAYQYFDKHQIPYKRIGKLIVATNPTEVERLKVLFERGQKNKVPQLKLIDPEEICQIEPKCRGLKALWSPCTGIVDWQHVCKHFAEEFKKMGGSIFNNFEVTSFAEITESKESTKESTDLYPISVQSKNRYILTKYVLTCTGLHSDRVAAMTGCDVLPRIVPFRGEYLLLKDEKKHWCKTNIYPVPDPSLPFLGVHFTPRMNGDVWLGPNAVLALSREGYSWFNVNVTDCIDMIKFPGLYKLIMKYIIPGSYEAVKSIFYPLAVKESQKFIPEISYKDVKRGSAGVRAQAMDNAGTLIEDFVFDNGTGRLGSRVLHVRNAASPGATSSMAIAKFISDKMEKDFKF